MNNLQRLSRKERRLLNVSKKAPIALGLAVLLFLLILGNTQWWRIERLFGSDDPGETRALAYSVAIQTGESFHLSDSSYTDSLLTQPGGPDGDYIIPRIRQPWPSYLPYEFYVERLRELSRDNGLTCDCIESRKERQLLCTIGLGASVGAQVIIELQSKTKLSGREVAFVFRNLGALSNEKIMEILDQNISFSYFASPDVYPSRQMKRTLERAGIVSIIELPVDVSNLAELGSTRNKQSPGNTRDRRQINYTEVVKNLFGRHPNPGAVFFKRSNGLDSAFVRSVIELARESEIAYLYENSTPDGIDSLAYSSGLTMISMNSVADFGGSSTGEIQPMLTHDLITSRIPVRKITLFDGAMLDTKEFIDLHNTLRRLGVNILACISLADVEESL